MSDDITIGVTEIVNNIEVNAQPNDQIIDISVLYNSDDVTLNITPTIIEININKGSSFAVWGGIGGTLSNQTDLQNALNLKVDKVAGERLINAAEITKLANTSGTNTGDQDLSGYATNSNLALKANIASPTFTGTVSGITASMVGLGNVNNTTDLLKPISTATQTALNLKADLVNGLVPQNQLPSYVDDVLEFTNLSSFPASGEVSKIYISLDSNKQYRWGGSSYIQITNGLIASTNDVPEGSNNLYFLASRVLSTILTGLSTASSAVISASDTVLSALGKLQGQVSINNAKVSFDSTSSTRLANTSGTNTGDNATNTQYSGLVSNANHTGDATGSTALTLATVNANVGVFGSATNVAQSTVNAKGLTTAIANVPIQIAQSQVNSLVSDLAGKQATLTNPITGTGTTNYLPKFSGVSSLGNSQVFDNGTNVGIGNTSPSAKLHIAGDMIMDDTINGRLTFANGSSQNEFFSTTTGFASFKNLRIAANDFIVSTGGTNERLRINSTGAATFSSSVTATDGYINNGANNSRLSIQSSGASTNSYTHYLRSGVAEWSAGMDNTDNAYAIGTSNGFANRKFQIVQSGAATFSSSVTASGFFQSSDRRLKTIIKRDGDVAYFKWKDGRDNLKHIGYIAQEVKKEYPDQVQKDDKGMLSVNYIEVLVAKIQDLENRLKKLENGI